MSERFWYGFALLSCRIRVLGVMHACVLCLWFSNMRDSCALRVCASILHDACVTVCLGAHEQVCVAYVCYVMGVACVPVFFVCGMLTCVLCVVYICASVCEPSVYASLSEVAKPSV